MLRRSRKLSRRTTSTLLTMVLLESVLVGVPVVIAAPAAAATGHAAAKALPPLSQVPAPPPAPVTPAPAVGGALPSMETGRRPAGPAELPWPGSAHDPGRLSQSPVVAPDDPTVLGQPWPHTAPGAVVAAPAIGRRGVAFVPSDDGTLAAVGSDATVLWTWNAGSPLLHTPSLSDDGDRLRVTVGSASGAITVLNGETGAVEWTTTLPKSLTSPVISALDAQHRLSVYANDSDGVVHGRTETPLGTPPVAWSTGQNMVNRIGLLARTDYVVAPSGKKTGPAVYGALGGSFVCLDAAAGTPLTGSPLPLGIGRVTAIVAQPEQVLVGGDRGVAAVSPDCGGITWTDHAQGGVEGLALAPQGFVLQTQRGLVAYEGGPQTWHVVWQETLPAPAGRPGLSVDAAGNILLPTANRHVESYSWLSGSSGSHQLWSVALPGTSPLTAPSIDGAGRLYVGRDHQVQVIDEDPAFKLVYEDTGPGFDLHSLREVYGTADPGRTITMTHGSTVDAEPSYPRDPGGLTWTGAPIAVTTIGNGAAGNAVAFPVAGVRHASPALSQLDDASGRSLLRDGKRYVAFTDTSAGASPRVRFTEVPFPASPKVLTATDFATAQGLDLATAATLDTAALRTAHPTFSPDGRKVAWTECSPFGGGLLVLDLTGTPKVIRLNLAAPEQIGCLGRAPVFSPDSRWIVYEKGTGIAGIELTGGGSFTSAPANGQESFTQPTWSPDGSRIAVTATYAGAKQVITLSGKNFASRSGSLATDAAHPSYHQSKFPRPRVHHLGGGPTFAPASQRPGQIIEVYGEGFDIIRPEANDAYFTHTTRNAPVRGQVVAARVDPTSGLGVLAVRVPERAGTGPLTVVTGTGVSSAQFVVLPEPLEAKQRRSVPGARIRVFGRGFDLSPASSTRVVFRSATGAPLYGTVQDGGIDGDREFLTVVVPDGVVDGPLRTESNVVPALGAGFGCAVPACGFVRLYPRVTIDRDDGTLAAYAHQVTDAMTMQVSVADVPVDPYFGTGRQLNLTVEPDEHTPTGLDWILKFRTPGSPGTVPAMPLPISQTDVVSAVGTAVFARGADPAWDRWGDLDVWLNDATHPARPNGVLRPLARAHLQTPRLNIPIVFVSGTSGSPLTLSGPPPAVTVHPAEFQDYSAVCALCFLTAQPGPVIANPAATDPQGPRVWLGPEMLDVKPGMESLVALCSQATHCRQALAGFFATMCHLTPVPCVPPLVPSHDISAAVGYSDLLAFTPGGAPVLPQIGVSATDSTFRSVTMGSVLAAITGYSREPVYEDLLAFLTGTLGPGNTVVPTDSLGRPMTGPRGVASPRPLGSGPNGFYVFPYDWRTAMPGQATALNGFISSVLARPDVSTVDTNPARPGIQPIDKVVLVTHSLGGPVSRLAYLQRPDLADQVISFGGAFGGVGKTIKILAMGDNWGIGKTGGPLDDLADAGWGAAVQPWKVRQLARNWPTAYDQSFNSLGWFADDGSVLNGRIIDRTVLDFPGDKTNTRERLMGFLRANNKTLADAAAGFWDPPGQPGGTPLDDFTAGTGSVFHYRVVGQGRSTNVGARRESGPTMNCLQTDLALNPARWLMECLPRPVWSRAINADGDNTVPYKTAIGATAPTDDRVFVMPSAGMPLPAAGAPTPAACAQANAAMTGDVVGACTLSHLNLPNYGVSLALINDILGGRTSNQGQSAAAGLPFFRQPNALPASSAVLEDLTLSTMSRNAPTPAATADRTEPVELAVQGVVQLSVRNDEGRLLGVPPSSSMARNEIPGADYDPATLLGIVAAGNSVTHLPGDQGYDVELTALGHTSASLVVRHGRAGFALPSTDLPSRATLRVHVEPAAGMPREVTVSEPGHPDRQLTVDMLDAAGTSDRVPPRSVATVADGRLTVRAADEASGVRDTWIMVDGKASRYSRSVGLPPGAAVSVFSTDRAGNAEAVRGPTGAPDPEEPVIALPLDKSGPAVGHIAVRGEPGRQIIATSTVSWLRITTDASSGSAIRLEVLRDQVPTGQAVGVVRLSYGDGQPASGLTVATGVTTG